MRVHNGYLGPCGQIRRSPSRTAVKNGLHADGDDPKPLLGPLSQPPGTPIQKLMLAVKVGISTKLPIGGNRFMRLRDAIPEACEAVPPVPELIEKGGRKSLCKSEECGASKHQDQIITVSAAAENGLDCSREGVSSNHQPIFHIHRLCGPPDRGRRRPSKVSSRGAPLWGKIGFRVQDPEFRVQGPEFRV